MKKVKFIFFILVFTFYSCDNSNNLSLIDLPAEDNQELSEFNVLQEDAIRVANMFSVDASNNIATQSTKQSIEKTLKEVFTLQAENNTPCMYVVNYNNNEGFVIVSATKKYLPVLAYSDKGNFIMSDNMPLGLTEWIYENKCIIDYQINNATDVEISQYIQAWKVYDKKEVALSMQLMRASIDDAMWNEMSYWRNQGYSVSQLDFHCHDLPPDVCSNFHAQAAGCICPIYDYQQYSLLLRKDVENVTMNKNALLTTQWDQNYPYNLALTLISGQLPPLGCSAVALGQVMAYHQHPNTYNWTTILSQGGFSSLTQNFLKDVAIAINTTFTLNGSSAYFSDVATALKNTYGYSSTVSIIAHNSATVRSQLNLNQPVIMVGERLNPVPNDPKIGHAWVCDGYKTHDFYVEYLLRIPDCMDQYNTIKSYQHNCSVFYYYHMNWGWGGTADGWFFSENVNPVLSTGMRDYQYNRYDMINIKKT